MFYCFFAEKYQKLESEKKTKRIVKKTITGAVIQYRSTRMPVIEEIDPAVNKNFDNKSEGEVCERTFITILNDPNDVVYDDIFKPKAPKTRPRKLKCTVTG